MTPAETDTFEDPRLKAAVRRAWGNETAPAALRATVAALATSAPAESGRTEASAPLRLVPAYAPRRRWREMFSAPVARYAMAAAAMVVIGFGLAYQLDRPNRQVSPNYGNSLAALPVSVTQGMVDRHDKCLQHPDHNAFKDLPPGDFVRIGQRMNDKLGFRVLSAPLTDGLPATGPAAPADPSDRWEFAGAAVCPVDAYPCSHFVYRRRGRNVAVSIFSIPRHACANITGEWECEYRDPRHPMAGVISDEGVYCVIGSSPDGSLTLNDVRQILDDLRRRTDLLPRRIPGR